MTYDFCEYQLDPRGFRVRITSKAEQRRARRKSHKALRRSYRRA